MVKIRGSKRRLAQMGHEKVASDSPPEENQPTLANHVVVDEDEVLDPDPIRWALAADGKSVYKTGAAFNEVQLVHMYHLGHMVGWSLEKHHNDRTTLTHICEKIGISRDQFRGWVYSKKFKIDKAGSSGSGFVRSGGNLHDEGGSSATD